MMMMMMVDAEQYHAEARGMMLVFLDQLNCLLAYDRHQLTVLVPLVGDAMTV